MVDDAKCLKIIDFGSATSSTATRRHANYVVSRYYRAPELLLGTESYSEKIDIWAVGCIIWEVLVGSVLFAGGDTADQLFRIIAVLGSPTSAEFKAMKVKDRSDQCAAATAK